MIRHLVHHRNKDKHADKATAVENEPDDGSPAKKGKAGKKILGNKHAYERHMTQTSVYINF